MSATPLRRSARIAAKKLQQLQKEEESSQRCVTPPRRQHEPLIAPSAPIKPSRVHAVPYSILQELSTLLSEFSSIPHCQHTYFDRIHKISTILHYVLDHQQLLQYASLRSTLLERIRYFEDFFHYKHPYEEFKILYVDSITKALALYQRSIDSPEMQAFDTRSGQLASMSKKVADLAAEWNTWKNEFNGVSILRICVQLRECIAHYAANDK